jgi:CRP-like cAMP-binding protein
MMKTEQGRAATRAHKTEDNDNRIPSRERVRFLKQTAVFSTFDRAHLDDIAWVMNERTAGHGEWLCHTGDKGDELYIIHTGNVQVIRETGPEEAIVYTAGPGEVLGEMSVLGHIPRTAGLRVMGPTRLFVIKGPWFIQLLRENADMSLAVIEMLVRRLAA